MLVEEPYIFLKKLKLGATGLVIELIYIGARRWSNMQVLFNNFWTVRKSRGDQANFKGDTARG